ncbi:recombinase family protein [Flavipsychrobacter stenotrophus]|uniref:Recombinase family protein n=1 Tax=Flavipsychrobacter stenotrophus TaxID=2077091 RepID=A0A2S7SYD9_9BACT|nr:recombinase family protein [Flavipsychrobacter stenotrophus]PQJ11963.1 recombinase family protein [Flavipsychrobacter stenotrophus]
MEQKKRIGIWVRVSTEFQVKDDSPEHHEQRARYYVEAKGWEVIEVYRLEAVSGKTVMELPEAKKMLRDIQTGRISALVFSKLARLARNTKELLEFSELFRKANADMISLAENIDTSSPSGRLFFTIIAAMAEWERAEIADRVAASVPIRAKMGKPLGGAAPFGYQWKGKELVIDQHEAPIRKLMYDLFIQHRKKGTVAKKLNEMGHRTRNGSEFSDTTIGRLLHDSTAKGVRLANYTKSLGDGKKWVVKPESEWVYITCPAIVTEEVWDNCHSILREQEEKNVNASKRGGQPAVHLFSGILLCGCSGKMYYHPDGEKYKCTKCRKTKIGTADIEDIYYDELKVFLLSDNNFDNFLSKAKHEISEKEKIVNSLAKDKKRIQADMDMKMDLYMAGQIPKDRFGDYYNPLDLQLRQIENTIPQIEAEIDVLKIEHLNGDAVKNEAQTMYERWGLLDKGAKRSFVERITKQIVIAGDELTIFFRYHPSYFQNPENTQYNFMDSWMQ